VHSARPHEKVLIWWGRWWAVQIVTMLEISFGFAVHWRRPMLDIYLGPLTVAIGRIAAITDGHERLRSRCRGFFIGEAPAEAVW
jgi:hypothetical protein